MRETLIHVLAILCAACLCTSCSNSGKRDCVLKFIRGEVGGLLNLSSLQISIDDNAFAFESVHDEIKIVHVKAGNHLIQLSYCNVYSRKWNLQSYDIHLESGKSLTLSMEPVSDKNQNSYSGDWILVVSSRE